MQTLIDDLVSANHILAHHCILDAFGHVSVRSPDDSGHFLLSRNLAPRQVSAADIMTFDHEGQVIGDDGRKPYLERFIHGEIYRARPDVMAIVHSHSPSVIPFGVVKSQPLQPIYHMAAGIGTCVPVFDIADVRGDATDMLIRDSELGVALAATLDGNRMVLMRGHGITIAAESLKSAVFNSVYAEMNARLQADAIALGPVTYLSQSEIATAWKTNAVVIDRAWDLWLNEIDD